MASIHQQVEVEVGADNGWGALRLVGEAHKLFAPVLVEAHLEGEIRTVRFANGMVARERIIEVDDERRRVAYSVVDGPEMTYHHASMQIVDAGPGRCQFIWITDFLPPDIRGNLVPLIEQGARALKNNLESRLVSVRQQKDRRLLRTDRTPERRDRMLSDKDAVATVAVKNLETARKFYEDTLGLTKVMENEEELTFKSGNSMLFVYRSQYAGTNKATAATWIAEEVDTLVRTLKGRGVNFEHYDLPNMTRQGDVHVAGTLRAAWFKDPDGNIFSIVTPADKASSQAVGASARSTA